jgi:hypothetical protein
MSGAPSDERSGLSFLLVTWTASVQFSKFASGPRQLPWYNENQLPLLTSKQASKQ